MSMCALYCEIAEEQFLETYDELHGEGALEELEKDIDRYNKELEDYEKEYFNDLSGTLTDFIVATNGGS